MTTKIKIEISQQHMPIVIEVLGPDGRVHQTQTLAVFGAAAEEYVHSGQMLRVREMTTSEMHHSQTLVPHSTDN